MSVAATVATTLLARAPVLRTVGRGLATLLALWGAWRFIAFLCTTTALAVNAAALALDARALTGAHIAGRDRPGPRLVGRRDHRPAARAHR